MRGAGRLEGGCGDEGCWEDEESLGGCAPWKRKKLGKDRKEGQAGAGQGGGWGGREKVNLKSQVPGAQCKSFAFPLKGPRTLESCEPRGRAGIVKRAPGASVE